LSLPPRRSWFRPRGLFGKYVIAFVGLIVLVLGTNGALETWFTYNDTIEVLVKVQSDKAEAAVRRIEQFVEEIERQISFATRASASTIEQRLADYQLLLQEVPAIEQLSQLDGKGMEQLMVNRSEVVKKSGTDYSGSPSFTEARGRSVVLPSMRRLCRLSIEPNSHSRFCSISWAMRSSSRISAL
jgi:hypothetical protein